MINTFPEKLRLWGRTKPLQYQIDENGCWNCVSHANKGKGYSSIKRGDKEYLVHRYVYEQVKGPIPDDMIILHSCDNRACMNPDHLSLGTVKDNHYDAISKDRHSAGERHGMAKITEQDVINIRKDSRPGTVLAKEHGVSAAMISNIRNSKNWSHVKEKSI